MSKIKVNEIEAQSGSTITIPTGQTLTVTDGMAASTITSGTLSDARLPTVPVSKGGTGLTSLGSANQILQVNSGASALEFVAKPSGGIRQVVQNVLPSGQQSSSSSTQSDLANSETSLTPETTSSKILVIVNLHGIRKSGSTYGEFDVYRKIGSGGSYSQLKRIVHGFLYDATSTTQTSGLHFTYLDSPSTTDQVFYKIRFRSVANVASIKVNVDSQETSTITLMEVTV